MNYFSESGRRIPSENDRVFGKIPNSTYHNPSYYYQLDNVNFNYAEIIENNILCGNLKEIIDNNVFVKKCEDLQKRISQNDDFKFLINGPHIPFIVEKQSVNDLGQDLEDNLLNKLGLIFEKKFPNNHFKAVLQSNTQLKKNISIDPNSRYEKFLDKLSKSTLVGWYFPCVTQEFDIKSQRLQMNSLPDFDNFCLSGGIDVCSALIGKPDLLISEKFYSPILCLSAYVHIDPRLTLLLKSYGPHMEFWLMTQMLQENVTQVSEQWTGGLTFYEEI